VDWAEEQIMDKWTFGLTMLLVGTGGTFATLGILSLCIALLGRLFPSHLEAERPSNRNH